MKQWAWTGIALAVSSCSGTGPEHDFKLDWRPCAGAATAECASTFVPLDWGAPGGPSIGYLVRRVAAPSPPSKRALVFIAGGPGSSGDGGVSQAASLQALVPDMDVIVPDHRGTGHSTWLGCDPTNPEGDLGAACVATVTAKYGARAGAFFSATQAARDVDQLVRALRGTYASVYVYGESYGTYLVNRFLNLYPSDVDGAVLDGVERPDGGGPFRPDALDTPANHVAKDIFDACGRDAFCSSKLGVDPWAALGALHAAGGGACAAALPSTIAAPTAWLKDVLYQLESTIPGAALAALVYRMTRCSAADAAAVAHFARHPAFFSAGSDPAAASGDSHACLLSPGSPSGACDGGAALEGGAPTVRLAPYGQNLLLHFNIELSDVLRYHPPAAALEAAAAATFVDNAQESGGLAQAAATWPWPLYDPEAPQQWADVGIPILLVEGTLDAKTPLYVLADAPLHFQQAHQAFIAVPNATHVTWENSPATPSTNGRPCGLQLIASFLAAPTGPLDTRCVGEIPALDFHGSAAMAQDLFGTDDLYE